MLATTLKSSLDQPVAEDPAQSDGQLVKLARRDMTDSPISRHARRSRLEWVLLIVVLLLIGGYFAYHLNRDHARIEARESERLSHQWVVSHDVV